MAKSIAEFESEIALLQHQLKQLEGLRCTEPEDVITLQILEHAPFTVWACNRDFEIVLWNRRCEVRYACPKAGAFGKNFFACFAHEHEREQAKADCLDIIDNGTIFANFIAVDHDLHGNQIRMLTNCFRVMDPRTNQFVQAEIGIDISDLHMSEERWRTIRQIAQRMEELKAQNALQELTLKRQAIQLRLLYSRLEKMAQWQAISDQVVADIRRIEQYADDKQKVVLRDKESRLAALKSSIVSRHLALEARLKEGQNFAELEELQTDVETLADERIDSIV